MKNLKKLILIAFLVISGTAMSQVTLSGVVKDSIGVPLEMANVIALDTVAKKIASYGFTDANGNFKLDLKKNTVYNVKISYVGFKEISEFVKTDESNIVKTYVMQEDNMLDGINIVAKMPVTVKGDTIVYNADSFKNGSERKLEDVLEKLPGVEINDDGQIEVEGKTVEKITVDGKDFFDGDTKLASKNIPSNAVDKIEVLRNFADVRQLSSVQNNQDRVAINIKLKEGKKNFWFGNITAGAGDSPNETLYLFQPKLFYYSPKYTINFIGDLNNIGESALNRRDVLSLNGGFRSQSPSNGTNLSIGSAGIGFLTAGANNANRIQSQVSALNFSYSPSEKLDLSGFLIWSGNENSQRNRRVQDFIDPTIPDDITENFTNQNSNTGLIKLSSVYRKDVNNQMNYDVIGRFQNEWRTDNSSSQVVGNNIVENENVTPFRINQNLSYFYTASEKSIFALEVQHLLQDDDPVYAASLENDPNSDEDGFDDTANQLGFDTSVVQYLFNQDRRVQSNQLDAKLDYYYIINQKSNLNFVGGTILSRQNFDSRFFQILDNGSQLDPTIDLPGLSDVSTTNDTEYNFTDIYAGVRYRLKSGIFTFTPGFTAHAYNVNNTQSASGEFKDTFNEFLPEFNMVAQFKNSESLTLDYRQSINFFNVNAVAEGLVANNFNSFFAGNNDLTNGKRETTSLNYRSFSLYNGINVFARTSYTRSMNQIGSIANFIPGSVISTRTNFNLPFDFESANVIGSFRKSFSKFRAGISGSYVWNKSFQFFGNNRNENVSDVYSITPSFNTNFREWPNISLRYRVSFVDQLSTNLETGQVANDFSTVTYAPSVSFDAYIWDALTVRADYSLNQVKQDGVEINRFDVLNASFSYRKNRDAKFEYELVGNNLLSTASRIAVSNGAIVNSINETFILPRFLSFRVRYEL